MNHEEDLYNVTAGDVLAFVSRCSGSAPLRSSALSHISLAQ